MDLVENAECSSFSTFSDDFSECWRVCWRRIVDFEDKLECGVTSIVERWVLRSFARRVLSISSKSMAGEREYLVIKIK